ncbi:hypothetical protein LguiB_009892 [Lonicera macranthoides]
MSDYVICKDFKLTLVSATEVEQVRELFKTKVYAAVAIGHNKTNPKWNHTMEYTIAATDVQNPVLDLVIELYINRTRGDKRVGYVSRPTCELFHHVANNTQGGITSLTLPLVTDGNDSKGVVTIEYSFREEKSVKKPSFVKKLANAGTLMAVKGMIMYTTGVYAPIRIRVFRGLEIVCSKATTSTIFGRGFECRQDLWSIPWCGSTGDSSRWTSPAATLKLLRPLPYIQQGLGALAKQKRQTHSLFSTLTKEGDSVLDLCYGSGNLAFLLSEKVGSCVKVAELQSCSSRNYLQIRLKNHIIWISKEKVVPQKKKGPYVLVAWNTTNTPPETHLCHANAKSFQNVNDGRDEELACANTVIVFFNSLSLLD